MNNKKLLIISGPTAVGKTDASLELARLLDGEIINADSMQVYRGLDIGTAKIRPDEMKGIPHHLFDVVEPDVNFDVSTYQDMAKSYIEDIASRGKLPILVGGTGFYIQAVVYDIDFSGEEPDYEYREKLHILSSKKGETYLHDMLRDIDPDSADTIHPHNTKRVIRALEFYHTTKTPISEHNKKQREKKSPYEFHYAVITMPRQDLYRRIDIRVDNMIEQGLIDEVKKLIDNGISRDMTSMQGLGYKEIASYLSGECSLDDAIYTLKRDTRHFAKRQLTWFKREKEVTYYDITKSDVVEDIVSASFMTGV